MQDICEGQLYDCTQSKHLDWRVEVVRRSATKVQCRVVTPSNYRNQLKNYKHDEFANHFVLIRDARSPKQMPEAVATSTYEPTPSDLTPPGLTPSNSKECNTCLATLPLTDFRHHHFTGSYSKKCRACIESQRQTSRSKKLKSKLPPPTMVDDIQIVTVIPPTLLSDQLLALATKVAELERTPALLAACLDVYVAAEYTYGVYIVPTEAFDKLKTVLGK